MSSSQRRLNALQSHLTDDSFVLTLEPCSSNENPGYVLFEERKKASFPIRQMTYFLDGSEEMTRQRERIMLEIERDPTFNVEDRHDLTRSESRERAMTRVSNVVHHLLNDQEHISRLRFDIMSLVDPGFMTRLGVHFGLFFGAVRGQATSEQMAKLVEEGCLTLKGMYGCFAMTELGHGSNVPGLETTATFNEASDEFIVHTPTLTATKWWIGGAAHTATHCVVFAQLIVKGKKYGVKSFVVQLRDLDGNLKPGINIGDIGAKMGRHNIDNGWIQFTNVRIPRGNMLMKHTKVLSNGTVQEPPLAQLTYGALIGGRVQMVMDSANAAKLALTIAIRYGAVRRQFAHKEGEPEKQILNYASHQFRLMPLLALAFAMHFGGMQTDKNYSQMINDIEGAGPDDKEGMKPILENLKATHATSAGLKAFCTWNTLSLIEQCRQALGGHGYSSYAGLAALYQDFAVQCSWEGDNTIMMMQTGRYLIGCYKESKNGITQPPGVAYLNDIENVKKRKSTAQTAQDIVSLEDLQHAFNCVTAMLVSEVGEHHLALMASGLDAETANEEVAVGMLTAAKAHCYHYLLQRFLEAITHADQKLQPALTKLCTLYALYNLQEVVGTYALQCGYYTSTQFNSLRSQVPVYCQLVRQDAIPLTDSFGLTDFVINSPLGRYDGDIYRHYFEKVKRAPGGQGKAPYFDSHIKPLLTRKLDTED